MQSAPRRGVVIVHHAAFQRPPIKETGMHKEGNVVTLASVLDRTARASLPCLPVLLLQVRDKAALQLRRGLQALFDNADDTLFELADKAADGHEQQVLFEAMRDLRLKRRSIEREFLDAFNAAFLRIGQRDSGERPGQAAAHGWAKPQYIERAVTLETIIERVLARQGQLLRHLTLRFRHLLDAPVDERRHPLGPACLCECFLNTVRKLKVAFKTRLVLLKLFERHVLRDIDLLYVEGNQMLALAGILPELKATARRRAEDRRLDARREPANQSDEEGQADSSGQLFMDSVRALLIPLRDRFSPRLNDTLGLPCLGRTDLVRLLTHLQRRVPLPGEDDDFDLGNELQRLLLRVGARSGVLQKISETDEDVINLVDLCFDHVLSDANLPSALRALLGRLRVPVLKVALLDVEFFSRAGHPARRLLNELAMAGIGWADTGEGRHDGLQMRMERLIHRLLDDFAEDASLLDELLDEFLAASGDERRRNDRLEQRVRDAEEGRVRWLEAQQVVQRELNLRLQGRYLPAAVIDMLVQGWSQVLLMAWLKHGEPSVPWTRAVTTMDALLASVAPKPHATARQELLEQVPGLLKDLREGLAGVSIDSATVRGFFQALQQLHLQACTEGDVAHEQGMMQVSEEIVLALPQEHVCQALLPPADNDWAMAALERLRVGSWMVAEEAGHLQRCKLVVRIDSADRLVFTNHQGRKVREWSRAGLVMALRRGEASVLDERPLFERTLQAVLARLRMQHAS